MAKKIVRGITNIKTISNQDLDTNNVNDLLSDGKHNYIHRKKQDGTEEYHNLTNNIKTIEAEDNGLLTVRNYNNSTNSAKLTVHHDPQKEQKIYSTDHTIEIVHGDNGTGELTNVDVNPEKVLEHDNLISNSDYVTISHEENSNTSVISTDELDSKINELEEAIESGGQKKIESTNSIAVVNSGTGLRLIYFHDNDYSHENGYLSTYAIQVGKPDHPEITKEIYNFYFKMYAGKTNCSFTLEGHDRTVFYRLLSGAGKTLNIQGVAFTLSGDDDEILNVVTNNATNNDYVITFSAMVRVSSTPDD